MQTIWKFPLDVVDEQTIRPPKGSKFLDIQIQQGGPCLWALVDPENPVDEIVLMTKGTGHPFEARDLGDYLATYQLPNGLVFHVFQALYSRFKNEDKNNG